MKAKKIYYIVTDRMSERPSWLTTRVVNYRKNKKRYDVRGPMFLADARFLLQEYPT